MKNINRRKTNDEFIKEAVRIHGDRYDYSEVDYLSNSKKIKILCKEHGSFFQTPKSHLRGSGCNKCVIRNTTKYTKEAILSKFLEKHGSKYKYDDFYFKNVYSEINVECPDHGNYLTTIKSHFKHGCKRCYYEKIGKNNLIDIDEFINRASLVHLNKYDYSRVTYSKTNDIIEIICPKHGSFFQKRNLHLGGNGCKRCNMSKGERKIEKFLIDNSINYSHQFTFYECRNINPLPFDFFLHDYNVCIEYDGVQHSAKSKHESFYYSKDIKVNDEIKNKYCSTNDITLLRIPHTVKNVSAYLTKKFINLKIMTTEEKKNRFIKKAIDLWGYKYNYDKVNYIDNKTPVSIGYKGYYYLQSPIKHLQGKKIELQEKRMSTDEFIFKSKLVWGERFDYSECEYLGTSKKVKLYDNLKHRWIEQIPKSHLKGYEVTKMSLDEFISECNLIHGSKYKILAENYTNLHSEVKLFCPYHGEITKKAASILYSSACRACPEHDFNKNVVSFLKNKSVNYFKNYSFYETLNSTRFFFNFYLPTLRTCIEFDGIQHFEPIEYFGGIESFEKQQKNDIMKQSYCEENFIDLIRIRYDRINSISDILWEALKYKL